jgi:hypothetical protein
MSRTELRGLVDATPAPDLPGLIGDLEAAKVAAWARLTAATVEVRPDEADPEGPLGGVGSSGRIRTEDQPPMPAESNLPDPDLRSP